MKAEFLKIQCHGDNSVSFTNSSKEDESLSFSLSTKKVNIFKIESEDGEQLAVWVFYPLPVKDSGWQLALRRLEHDIPFPPWSFHITKVGNEPMHVSLSSGTLTPIINVEPYTLRGTNERNSK